MIAIPCSFHIRSWIQTVGICTWILPAFQTPFRTTIFQSILRSLSIVWIPLRIRTLIHIISLIFITTSVIIIAPCVPTSNMFLVVILSPTLVFLPGLTHPLIILPPFVRVDITALSCLRGKIIAFVKFLAPSMV